MKTVIFSHGDKGGVGKSVVAAAMVDLVVEKLGACTALDGDNKTPDMRNRFLDAPQVSVLHMQINRAGAASEAVGQLAGIIENSTDEFIIVNLPSNAGDTLDGMGEMLLDVCEDLGVRMVVTYSLGEHDEAADGLNSSLDGRFLSAFTPQDRMVLFPAFIGGEDRFAWSHRPESREYTGRRGVFPYLEPKFVFTDVIRQPGLFSEMVIRKPQGFTAYHKVALRNWRRAVADLMEPLLFPGGVERHAEGCGHDDA
ncbi:protein MobD [Acidithiobacillus sp. GGI-221]|nr:protein MobD [Acidithiobacillus sp. GGI-221]